MKKIIITILTAFLTFGFFACKTTNQVQDLSSTFNKVYDNYLDVLDLTDAGTYTVKENDTLTAIAKSNYGTDNGYYFPLIMLASRNVVQDPEFISPGMELTIPSFEKNINNAEKAKVLSLYFKDISDVYKKKKTKAAPDIREKLTAISNELANK
ncbi:MAG: LysM peptidoglycan-binding domain-containing protein [Treponema sp.]|nr:LysM peptidoglycan-binding domain-containing protein [Treponema sp.]